jgi:hypothetical protein
MAEEPIRKQIERMLERTPRNSINPTRDAGQTRMVGQRAACSKKFQFGCI